LKPLLRLERDSSLDQLTVPAVGMAEHGLRQDLRRLYRFGNAELVGANSLKNPLSTSKVVTNRISRRRVVFDDRQSKQHPAHDESLVCRALPALEGMAGGRSA
jgi:hypothetical protein